MTSPSASATYKYPSSESYAIPNKARPNRTDEPVPSIGASVAAGRYEIGIALAILNLFTMVALIPLKRRLDSGRADVLHVQNDKLPPE